MRHPVHLGRLPRMALVVACSRSGAEIVWYAEILVVCYRVCRANGPTAMQNDSTIVESLTVSGATAQARSDPSYCHY